VQAAADMASMPLCSLGTTKTMVRFLKDRWTRDLFNVQYLPNVNLGWDGKARNYQGLGMRNAISGNTPELRCRH